VNLPIPILSVLVGAVILLFGRKLFWLCVAAVGFAAGVEVAPLLVHQPSATLALTVALVLGFIGALFALFLQKLAIAMVGFLTGGKLALAMASAFFVQLAAHPGITFLVGGIIGALLLLIVFDWALVVLSSLVGAYLIRSVITLPPSGSAILFVVLVAIGVGVQVTALRGRSVNAA
jgi:Domain of unknown function (DUF4203)